MWLQQDMTYNVVWVSIRKKHDMISLFILHFDFSLKAADGRCDGW